VNVYNVFYLAAFGGQADLGAPSLFTIGDFGVLRLLAYQSQNLSH